MPFEKILDGFVYATLIHKEMSVPACYNAYMEILKRWNIPEPDNFMLMLKSAENARKSENFDMMLESTKYTAYMFENL